MDSGDVYIQEFSTLPYKEYTGWTNQGQVSINMKYNLLDAGEIIRLECFENSDDIDPYFTNDFNNPTDSFSVSYIGKWQDLNGEFKLTMLSGSVNLDIINVQVIKDGNRYFQSFSTPSVVPEPSALLLMGFSGIITAFIKRRHKA